MSLDNGGICAPPYRLDTKRAQKFPWDTNVMCINCLAPQAYYNGEDQLFGQPIHVCDVFF